MDERQQDARQFDLDVRHEKTRGRQILRDAVSCRLRAFFVTLRAEFPQEADVILQRAERRAARQGHAAH